MGIDGSNTLLIRGSEDILNGMEISGLIIDGVNNEIDEIAARFFGHSNIRFRRITPNLLKVSYEFRNMPVYQYLEQLLYKYPMCWFKNTFYTENGDCGLWIGRYLNNNTDIQIHEWKELSHEEIYFETDFSKE